MFFVVSLRLTTVQLELPSPRHDAPGYRMEMGWDVNCEVQQGYNFKVEDHDQKLLLIKP